MLWLRGVVRVEELVWSEREGPAHLQRPRRTGGDHWLTLDCADGRTEFYELSPEPDPERGPYRELTALADRPDSTARRQWVRAQAEAFGTRWGLPLLPALWEHDSRVAPRPIYVFPAAEFWRMATLTAALSRMLAVQHRGHAQQRRELLEILARVSPEALIPWGGEWQPPMLLRATRQPLVRYQLSDRPFPVMEFDPAHLEEFGGTRLPRAFDIDPFWALRRLARGLRVRLPSSAPMRPQQAFDWVAQGVGRYAALHPESLWSFILLDWLQRYLRRGGAPYCQYVSPEGETCAEPLPPSAPTNRRYCERHQAIRQAERKRDWARQQRQAR
jgi:hypothetical protein